MYGVARGATAGCVNPSAQNVESALGSARGGIKGLPTPFLRWLLTLPHPTAHPECGWAAGPSVCWFCCSPAPRWGSSTQGPGTRRTSGYLLICGRPCRAPPGQSSPTSPPSPAMPTSGSGSRSKWWGECQEWWRQCVTPWGVGGELQFPSQLSSNAWVFSASRGGAVGGGRGY